MRRDRGVFSRNSIRAGAERQDVDQTSVETAQPDKTMSVHQEPGLTQHELETLLKRGVDRDTEDRPDFTHQDLVAAGQELGVSGQAIEAVYEEHLAAREGAPGTRTRIARPMASKIRLEASPGRFFLDAPAPRFRVATFGVFATLPLWFFIIVSWSFSRAAKEGFGMVVGLVVWGAGVIMAWRLVRSMAQHVTLDLQGDQGRLVRRFGGTLEIFGSQLRARVDPGGRDRYLPYPGPLPPALVLDHGAKRYMLLRGYSPLELEWVAHELNQWLGMS